ncbi:MAG: V-type ATP synthase subunit B [Clostridiales bacterium]|nr:V-type ATP synthase subunit B [Clostridiales bacterium]
MKLEYIGLENIDGPLVVLSGVKGAKNEEIVEITVAGKKKLGKIIELREDACVVQVFEGTRDLSLTNTRTKLTGNPMMMPLSEEILGRILNGRGKPIDGLGDIYAKDKRDINGMPINPVARKYPRDYIQTGISSIDGLTTLIRGQKLPIFSGNGLPHNKLAAQIVKQAKIAGENFAVVFVAMGVKYDVAEYFKRSFTESGVLEKVVMLLNLANDPVVERIITPRCGLTIAEYLAFTLKMHVLVIMTDMTSYAEALREVSSSKNEIPSRKGFPGYLYSDLASLYERAGMLKDQEGSITQIPILTMPNDDITHPVPDLTAYITEGQIVLGRELFQKGVYPPITILPSLSRLMKDGIGEGFTREDHPDVANQLFASFARVQEIRALAAVIGEDELSEIDQLYIRFGKLFEKYFIAQSEDEERDMEQTLTLGWTLLGFLPVAELDRMSPKLIEKYYKAGSNERLLYKGI